jgi:hypothetical protein
MRNVLDKEEHFFNELDTLRIKKYVMLPAGPSETLSLQILTLPFIEKLGR